MPTLPSASDASNLLLTLRDEIRAFVRERDWEQFHTPKNLAMALTVEAAELQEVFQWLPDGTGLDARQHEAARHELADTLVYLIRLADVLDVDLATAVREKMALNAAKYPADKVRGDSRKYSEYE
jgi:NTP pyrophosphatase (non-canonical NTP hydrolase)